MNDTSTIILALWSAACAMIGFTVGILASRKSTKPTSWEEQKGDEL